MGSGETEQRTNSTADGSTGPSSTDGMSWDESRRDFNTERPAVGIVARRDETDAVARSVLRANARGHSALVVNAGTPDVQIDRLTDQCDAIALHPTGSERSDDHHRRILERVARWCDFPGLLYHADPSSHVDYRRSKRQFERATEYVVSTRKKTESPSGVDGDVLVAIPAYNEASSIGEVVDTASEYADEVLVVDDGSTDETATRARFAGATVVEHGRNRGYGATLRTAFSEARKRGVDHLVTLDGDGQHDPRDVPRLVERQQQCDAEVVIGNRYHGDRIEIPRYRRFGLRIIDFLTNASIGLFRKSARISDTQSGFRAYDRRAISALAEDELIGDHMNASTDILYRVLDEGYVVEEVGTTIRYDVEDASSYHPITHGLTLLNNILKTVERKHPMTVLGVPGFTSSFVGFGLGYWALTTYVETQSFPHVQAVIAGLLLLSGVFACFTAIVLHAFNHHGK